MKFLIFLAALLIVGTTFGFDQNRSENSVAASSMVPEKMMHSTQLEPLQSVASDYLIVVGSVKSVENLKANRPELVDLKIELDLPSITYSM